MKLLKVQNASRHVELGWKIRRAASWTERAVGLLSTPALRAGDGLWISPCKSIHTFFMRYPIDVLFLDDGGRVLYQKTFQPWRISGWHAKSHGVLELASGTLNRTGTRVGDRIEFKELQ